MSFTGRVTRLFNGSICRQFKRLRIVCLRRLKRKVSTDTEQNIAILDETHRLGKHNRDDLIQLQEKQQAHLATLSAQNTLHVGSALLISI